MASANNKNTVAAATTILQSGEGITQTAPPSQNSLTGLGLEHQDQTAKTAAWILMSFQSNPHRSMSYSPTPPNLNSQGNTYTQIPKQSEAPSKLFNSVRSNLMQPGSESGTAASQRDYNTNGAFVSLSQAMSQYMTPTVSDLLSQGQRDSTGNLRTSTSQNSFASHHQYHMGTHLPQDRNFPSNGFGNLIATHNQTSDRGINIYNSYEMQQRDFYQAASQSFLLQKQTSNQMNEPSDVRQEAVDLRIGSLQKNCDQPRDQQTRDELKHVAISHQNSVTKQRETNLKSLATRADKISTIKSSKEGNNSSMSDLATHLRTVQQQPFNILSQSPGFGVFQQSTQSSTPPADKTVNKALNEDNNSITSDQAMSFSLAQQQQHLNFLRQTPNYAMFQPPHFLSSPMSSQNMSSHFPYASQNSFLPYVFNPNGMGAAAMTQGNPYYLPMSMFPTAEAYYSAGAANLAQFPSMTGHSNSAQFAPSFTQSSGTNKPTNPAAKPPRSRKKATSTATSSAKVQNVNSNLQSKNPGLAQLLNPNPHLTGSYYNSGMINNAALSEVSPSNPNGNEQNSNSGTKAQSKQNKQMKRKPKENTTDEAIHPNPIKKWKSADMDWYQNLTVDGKHPEELEDQMKGSKQSMISELQTKNTDVRCSSEMSTENKTLRTLAGVGGNGVVSEKSCSDKRAFSPAYMQEYKESSLISLSQIVNAVSVHTDTISSQSYSRQSYQSSLCNIDPTSTRDFLEEDTSQTDKLMIPESSFQPFSSLPLYQSNSKVDNESISQSKNTAKRQENEIPQSANLPETQQKYGTFTDTCQPLINNYSQASHINNSSSNSQWTTASSETQSIFNAQNSSESHLSGSRVQSRDGGVTEGNILSQNADGGLSTPVTSMSNCDSVPSMSCLHVDTGINKSDDDGHSAMFNSPEEVQVYPTCQHEPPPADCLVKESEGEAAGISSHENKLMFSQNMTGEHSSDRNRQSYVSAECNDSNSQKTEKTIEKSSAQIDRKDEDITHKTSNCYQKYQPDLSGPFNVQNNTSLTIPDSANVQYSHMPTDHNKSYEPLSLENISTAVNSSGDYLTWPQYGGYTKENKNPYSLPYLPPYLKSPTKHQGVVHEADPVGVPDQVSAFSYMWDRTNVLAPGDKQEADFDSSVVQKCDFDSRLSGVSPEDALLLRPKCNSQAISNNETFLMEKEISEDLRLWSHKESHKSSDPDSGTKMVRENVTQKSLCQSTVLANQHVADLASGLFPHDSDNSLTQPLISSKPSQLLVSGEANSQEKADHYLGDSSTHLTLVDRVMLTSHPQYTDMRTHEVPELSTTCLPDNQTIKQEVGEDNLNCHSPSVTQINGSEAHMKIELFFEDSCKRLESDQTNSKPFKAFFTGIIKKNTSYCPKGNKIPQRKVTKVQTKISSFLKSNHKQCDGPPQSIDCKTEKFPCQLTSNIQEHSKLDNGRSKVKVEVTYPCTRLQKRNHSPNQGHDNPKSKKLKLSQPAQSLVGLPVFSRGSQMLLRSQGQNLLKHSSLPIKPSPKSLSTFKTPNTSIAHKSSRGKKLKAVTKCNISKTSAQTPKLKNTNIFDLTKLPATVVIGKINSICVESDLTQLCPLGALEKLGLFKFPLLRDKYFVVKVEDNNSSCKPLIIQMTNSLATVGCRVKDAKSGGTSKSSQKNSIVSSTNGIIKASNVKVALPAVSKMVCDICSRHYSCTTEQHINGDGHQAIVNHPDFYTTLDAQILSICSVDAFIQLVIKVQYNTKTVESTQENKDDLDFGESTSLDTELLNKEVLINGIQIHTQTKLSQISLDSGLVCKESCNLKLEEDTIKEAQVMTYIRPLDKEMIIKTPVLNVLNMSYIPRKRQFSDICTELTKVKRQKTSEKQCCMYESRYSSFPCDHLSQQLGNLEISTRKNLGKAVAQIKLPMEVGELDQGDKTFECEIDELLRIVYPRKRTRKLPKIKPPKKPRETFVFVKDLCPVSSLYPFNLTMGVSSVNLFNQCFEELQAGARFECISPFLLGSDSLKQSAHPKVGAADN